MTYEFNCTGNARKDLVKAIASITCEDAKYLGAPSFAYKVDYITIDKTGALHMDDNADPNVVDSLIDCLEQMGFHCFAHAYDDPQPEPATETAAEEERSRVMMLRSLFTADSLVNMQKLVDAKADLIKKALQVENLPIEMDEHTVSFPWIRTDATPDEFSAYTKLITAMVEMANKQKRVTAKEKPAESDKYAFRCFLLRLGFIGVEHKVTRKILLRNLTGSSAFKATPSTKEVAE